MNNLGARIRKAREAKGYRQDQIAEYCGVSSASIVSNWELDHNEPSCDTLVKLAEILGVSLNYLLDYDEPDDGKDRDPLLNVVNELGPQYYEDMLEQSKAELKRRELIRKTYEGVKTTLEVQRPLFLNKNDPDYKSNKQRVKELAKIKADRAVSDMQITEFLWAAGFGDNIVCADVMAVFLRLKVPNFQLITYIDAFLNRKFRITLD